MQSPQTLLTETVKT